MPGPGAVERRRAWLRAGVRETPRVCGEPLLGEPEVDGLSCRCRPSSGSSVIEAAPPARHRDRRERAQPAAGHRLTTWSARALGGSATRFWPGPVSTRQPDHLAEHFSPKFCRECRWWRPSTGVARSFAHPQHRKTGPRPPLIGSRPQRVQRISHLSAAARPWPVAFGRPREAPAEHAWEQPTAQPSTWTPSGPRVDPPSST